MRGRVGRPIILTPATDGLYICQESKNLLYCKTKSDLAVQRQDESSICVAKAECD